MQLGSDITAEDLLDQISFFSSWEEKYSFIIDLGKSLSALEQSDCIEENLVKGCQSQVWIVHHKNDDNNFIFNADSDALIVKGLLAIVLTALNYKTAEEILAFNVDEYFGKLDLLNHISSVRGNGLKAMCARIQDIAQASLV